MADYESQLDKPEAAATPSGRGVTAVGRTGSFDVSSPSGTDWNQTFKNDNPYSPSGTNWSKTFGRTSTALAGNTTPPPSPGDIDNTFFGGPTPTPTPKPKPSLAFYRNRLSDADLTSRDREMYGAGSDFGFLT